jgi:hypothetical protein
MAVTAHLYDNFLHIALENGLGGSILDQAINVALFTNAVAPDQTKIYLSEEIALMTEASGAGYTHLGAALGSKTCTVTGHVTKFDAADTVWTTSTITARYALLFYNKTGDTNHTASLLIGYVDFGEDKISSAGNFTIAWSTSGIFTLTVA